MRPQRLSLVGWLCIVALVRDAVNAALEASAVPLDRAQASRDEVAEIVHRHTVEHFTPKRCDAIDEQSYTLADALLSRYTLIPRAEKP